MKKSDKEFQEIGHCGGKVIIDTKTDERGHRLVSFGVRHSGPTPAAWVLLRANPLGEPVMVLPIGGLADPPPEPPKAPPGYQVFLASDSEGMFGNQCPRCKGYWRSGGIPATWPSTCPYCHLKAWGSAFRTPAQRSYVYAVCAKFDEVISSDFNGETVIDMDEVAAAVASKEKPPFYYAEERQQNSYKCDACGADNDILGRYGFCSSCGVHNGMQVLQSDMAKARARIAGGQNEGALTDAVSAFDSYARQLAKHLVRTPMRRRRREKLEALLFHNLRMRAQEMKEWFDIDFFHRISDDDIEFAQRCFLRRHVYEHNGGEVDQRYLDESGDTSVRLKQHIRESSEAASRLVDIVERVAGNLKTGFDDIFPGEKKPLEYEADRKQRLTRR